jgi:WW domain
MVGMIVGSIIGFLLFVLLTIYGYSVYKWQQQGLYGNTKPAYKYQQAQVGKDKEPAMPEKIKQAEGGITLTSLSNKFKLGKGETKTAGVAPVAPAPSSSPKEGKKGKNQVTEVSPKGTSANELPAHWTLHKDAEDREYFFNTVTGQSQWTRPSS